MVTLALAWIGMACWIACFWWMHRISSRQDKLMHELREMTERIEHLSKEEHTLIREVHPAVDKIKEQVEEVADAVSSDSPARRGA